MDNAELIRRLSEGETVADLAKEMGRAKTYLCAKLNAMNAPRYHGTNLYSRDPVRTKAEALQDAGFDIEAAHKLLGKPRSTVARWYYLRGFNPSRWKWRAVVERQAGAIRKLEELGIDATEK